MEGVKLRICRYIWTLMKKGISLLFPLCFLFTVLVSGNVKDELPLDTLKARLLKEMPDTNRVKLLYATCWEFRKTNLDSAVYYGEAALNLSKKINYLEGIAVAYNNLAIVYRDRGDYTKAVELFQYSSDYYRKANDIRGYSSALNNLGGMYGLQRNMPKALEYFKKSMAVKIELGDKRGIANALNNIGNVYNSMKMPDSAMSCYLRSIDIKKALKDDFGISQTLSNIGTIYADQKNYNKALQYYQQSLEIKEKLGDQRGAAISLIDIASCYRFLKDYDKALLLGIRGLEMSKKIGVLETMGNAEEILARIYADKKQFEQAFIHLEEYLIYKDSLFDITNQEKINELQTRYETVEKDKILIRQKADLELKDAENNRRSMERNAFVVGFILLGITAFFIFRGYNQKKKANLEIIGQKAIIEEKNKEILDSIHYAKRIQGALLASDTLLKKNLPEFFVFYKPKDIVSGDFYWASSQGDNFLIAVGDCTGHGVPGAFMSLLNINLLKESAAEKQILRPDLVLNNVREGIIKALNPEGSEVTSQDGMDAVLCCFDFKRKKVQVACANNPLWIVPRSAFNVQGSKSIHPEPGTLNPELIEVKPDKMPVGLSAGAVKPFTLHEIDLHEGDMLYLITDGYADQFGGPKGKKFKYKALQELLVKNSALSTGEQKKELERVLNEWKGSMEQVDDILIMGIRV
jgi:tetratricopeptide (TPR) repeat protein